MKSIIIFDQITCFTTYLKTFTFRQTFAHELGHALNMPHDFHGTNTEKCITDKNGDKCCQQGSVMDYFQVISNL